MKTSRMPVYLVRVGTATVLSIAVGSLVAAASTLSLFVAFRYCFYRAILAAGGGSYTLGGATGIFVSDEDARPGMDWLVFGYFSGSFLVALAIGLCAGYWVVCRVKLSMIRTFSPR
ncbi:hypothetical protein AWB85_21650 [Mycobacteroides immunogenum]|uniref:Uncharacterized protein n=1 Tax=Mycobacteroides immunogenum TaxID=83262 RepID=A0A179VBV1_9MYCO|nr:hypothetical protein [Mycobacteroides immunogenum]OAT69370.1 hypothetical protein AWB85_21650 [Mycobacteroides immunogenum]